MTVLDAIHADLVAIRRAYMKGGKRLACSELQRRWPAISDDAAPIILERILTVKINAPEHDEPRRDGPKSTRRRPW